MEKYLLKMKNDYIGSTLNHNDLNLNNTAVVIIDMVNGFAKHGSMSSERVLKMSKKLEQTLSILNGSSKVFFRDAHTTDSEEFKAYPPHCINGTEESELTDEIKKYVDDKSTIICKNSTNGFLTKEFAEWLKDHDEITTFIVTGCVTDICVSDFTRSLQCYIYENELDKKIIIPIDCVETFDSDTHNADVFNVFALYNMHSLGINIVDTII